ncbi:MAG: hypothetical protein AAGA96_14585, partial [Verrucomicrobiota bacterium]
TEKSYQWSTDPSKKHKLFFIHDTQGEVQGGRQVIHRMEMGMTQIGVWKELGEGTRGQTTIGGSITRNEIVPDSGTSQYVTRDLQFEVDSPIQIFSWSSSESKRSFSVSLLFTANKAEQDSARQSTTQWRQPKRQSSD